MSQSQMGWLIGAIESDIIPRLLALHRGPGAETEATASGSPQAPLDDAAVAELASFLIVNDTRAVLACVEALRAAGLPLDGIYLRLLAPVARHLGELWDADRCDFAQVTVGLWRLQQLMYELSPAFHAEARHGEHGRRAMLVPVPGSQHTLGLLMVSEFFRRAGWDVWGDPAASTGDLADAARSERFDIVGFSVGTPSQVGPLAASIAAIRAASSNPGIKVMVGGPAFVADPALVRFVGADATAVDAEQAVQQAERLLACCTP